MREKKKTGITDVPAGSLELCWKTVIAYGADAVYLGWRDDESACQGAEFLPYRRSRKASAMPMSMERKVSCGGKYLCAQR